MRNRGQAVYAGLFDGSLGAQRASELAEKTPLVAGLGARNGLKAPHKLSAQKFPKLTLRHTSPTSIYKEAFLQRLEPPGIME